MRTGGYGRDSSIAKFYAAKLFRMNLEQQIPGARGLPVNFLGGPHGPYPVEKEHGEIGILQLYATDSAVLVGGGKPRSFTDAVSREPNSVGLNEVTAQMLLSDNLKQMRI